MKVKIVDNGAEKLVEASYIIIEGVALIDILKRLETLEQNVAQFVKEHNDREKVFKKLVEKI